jgi:hypothetical protein
VTARFTLEQITGSGEEPAQAGAQEETAAEPENNPAQKEEVETEKSAPGGMVYNADFSQPDPAWKSISAPGNGTVTIEDGHLVVTALQPKKYVSMTVPWNFTNPVTDMRLSFKATVNTPNMGAFGIFCRVSDTKEYYMVMLQPEARGGGQYRFYKGMGGKSAALTEWKTTKTLYGGEIEEGVTFSCIGDTMSLEVNGKPVDSIKDSDVKSGHAVLYAYSYEEVTADNPYRISIDSFTAEIP